MLLKRIFIGTALLCLFVSSGCYKDTILVDATATPGLVMNVPHDEIIHTNVLGFVTINGTVDLREVCKEVGKAGVVEIDTLFYSGLINIYKSSVYCTAPPE